MNGFTFTTGDILSLASNVDVTGILYLTIFVFYISLR